MCDFLIDTDSPKNTALAFPSETNSTSELALGHVAICVKDLDQAIKFYQSLDLKLSYKTIDIAYLYSGNQGIALMRIGSKEAKPHFGFACKNIQEVEQIHNKLKDQGISVTPIQYMGPAAAFYGQDLDGNRFEYIYEPVQANVNSQPINRRKTKLKSKGFGVNKKKR